MSTFAATGTLAAATHSHSLVGLVTVAVLALVIVTAGYLTRCWLFPFTTCHHPDPAARGAATGAKAPAADSVPAAA